MFKEMSEQSALRLQTDYKSLYELSNDVNIYDTKVVYACMNVFVCPRAHKVIQSLGVYQLNKRT